MSQDPKPEPEVEKEPAAEEAAPKKTSLIVHVVVFLLVTALAAGAGFGVSMFLDPGSSAGSAQNAANSQSGEMEKPHEKDGDGHEVISEDGGEDGEGVSQSYAKSLAPILTNLAAPDDVWVRMELAVVGKAGLSAEILEQIHQDLFAYMRTVKLHHVEGPSGYTNLRAELSVRILVALVVFLQLTDTGFAQSFDLESLTGPRNGQTSGQIIQLFGLLTVLAVAPGILVVVTSFTRFIIAFSILRMGIGLQTTPANLILISLSLFMTFHVMSPTFDRAWSEGVQPLVNEQITEAQAFEKIAGPFKEFMVKNVRDKDLGLFSDIALENDPTFTQGEDVALRVIVPAFMISEIRRGFEIGFLILVPFLVIDLIVATITMAMGMMMLPPTVVALPFKVLFFILIDGWNLLVGSMMRSFL